MPDIDSYIGLMHTFFALDDMYGIKLGELDGARCLRLDKNSKECLRLFEIFQAWQSVAAKAESVEIASGEYDEWCYTYPALDMSQRWAKVPSQKFSGRFTEALKDLKKEINRHKKTLPTLSSN